MFLDFHITCMHMCVHAQTYNMQKEQIKAKHYKLEPLREKLPSSLSVLPLPSVLCLMLHSLQRRKCKCPAGGAFSSVKQQTGKWHNNE